MIPVRQSPYGKPRRLFPVIAGLTLSLTILACNFGAGRNTAPTGDTAVPTKNAPADATSAPTDVSAAATSNAGNPTPTIGRTGGVCANPLLPIVVAATWSYKLTGPIPDTFTRSILAINEAGFTDQDTFGTGAVRKGEWKCENGNLTALDPTGGGPSASVDTTRTSSDFHTTANEGVTMPATIHAGYTWTQTTTIEGTQTINKQTMTSKNEFSNTCTAAGTESVTVPAGIFEAVRVDCQIKMIITITMLGSEIPTTINMNTTNWYAPNVGLVKSVSTGTDLNTTIELTSYSIP